MFTSVLNVLLNLPSALCQHEVVVQLILDLKRSGHPSFDELEEEDIRANAEALPADGVPQEVLQIINNLDDAQEKLQPQKAATPCDGLQTLEQAGETFAAQRPRAAVAEGLSNGDASQATSAALKQMVEGLQSSGSGSQSQSPPHGMPTFEVRAGNSLIDQFQPRYFATAFCFCFQYATALPDVTNYTAAPSVQDEPEPWRQYRRRSPNAPKVEIQEWAAAMQRRVEAQFRRDWNFGFTVWNYLFRTNVNLQQNAHIYKIKDAETGQLRNAAAKEVTDGVIQLHRHLHLGTYRDVNGEDKPINGDTTKLWYVPNLSDTAKTFLKNFEARTRNIPGTHEIRKTMRHQTHANRICYGTSLFVTFSPSERDTALMLRLARVREEDPALTHDAAKGFQGRRKPRLDADFQDFVLDAQRLAQVLTSVFSIVVRMNV